MKDGVLDMLLVKLVKNGFGGSTHEVLRFLGCQSETTGLNKKHLLTLIDLGLRPEKEFRLLARTSHLFGVESGNYNYLTLGRLGHAIVAYLCSMQNRTKIVNNQLTLFDKQHQVAKQLELRGLGLFRDSTEDISVRSLREVSLETAEILRASENFLEGYTKSTKYFQLLLFLIQKVTGFSINSTYPLDGVFERWLWINALLCWASAFLNLLDGNLPLPSISEIQVIDRKWGLSGGRVDGVEVILADRNSFKPSNRNQFRSLGHLASHLHRIKMDGMLRIVEWKFSVGDNKNPKEFISCDSVSGTALVDHIYQVERYLALGTLDEHLNLGTDVRDNFWSKQTFVREGCIVYFFPTTDPIMHSVTLSPEQKKEVFIRDIVNRWDRGCTQKTSRDFSRHCLSLLSQSPLSDTSTPPQNTIPLEQGQEKHSSIVTVINQHRVFMDGNRIIENRNGRYVLHLNQLISCLKAGLLRGSSNFKLPQGGLICCPVHEDRQPSFSVRILDGFFYCFARRCKISGQILIDSLPNDIRTEIDLSLWTKRKEFFKDLAVPEDHHNLLGHAQALLSEQFLNSEGERYVQEKRKIDPNLAYDMGAGFGTSKVIAHLLDKGFSVEDLARVGFVRFSSRVSSRRGLYNLFMARGMKLVDIRKELGKSKEGKSLFGLPYFALDGRVTFPLKIRRSYTNIYGRSIYPDAKIAHIKLSAEESGVHHGAFNEDILYSDTCGEVVVTEGVFDAISLTQMFGKHTVAVIGTKNNLIAELLVQSGKDVAIAFDNDQAGREDTERLRKIFISSPRFKKRVRNFTESFITGLYGDEFKERYTGLLDWRDYLGWDDWNTLMIEYGKWVS